MARGYARFDVYLVDLEPTRGSEIAKRRPCAIVSPEEVNLHLRTVTIVPLTSTRKGYPHRLPIRFGNVEGEAATDQIRAVDKTRLLRFLGRLDPGDARGLSNKLIALFAY
jgi:mRNA interferase MazF